MPLFEHSSFVEATPEELYDWHVRPGALQRLNPPWQPLRRLAGNHGVVEGGRVVLKVGIGPVPVRWEALHRDLEPGRQFVDEQVEGPFPRWIHTHRFEPREGGADLRDLIDFRMPFGPAGRVFGESYALALLRRMFRYRHDLTRGDLERHRQYAGKPRLAVAVSGASGLVGSQLCAFLTTGGHRVVRLVRESPRGPDEVFWNPAEDRLDAAALEGVDAVVHLAGESIAGLRWSPRKKQEILRSRTAGTSLLARALAAMDRKPRVFLCASAVGYYGDRGDEVLAEDSPPGEGFLAEVCRAWESAADPAREAGLRVVHLRTGVVLTPAGGALRAMLPAFLAGVGGPVGDGSQYLGWIAMDDLVGLYHHLLFAEVSGPVNGVAGACPNAEFARTLGRVLRRPALLPLPAPAVRLLLGEMGESLLLHGARVDPARLREAGFPFRHPDLEGALRHELGRTA